MRIVVTGASGNVGTALLRRLLQEGGHEITGVVRRPPTDAGEPYDAVRWVAADLSDGYSARPLRDAVAGADAVVHLAWGFQPSHDIEYLTRLGVDGTARVVEAVEQAGVPHLVHLSSVGAYAPRTGLEPVDESYPTTGIASSWYSRSKSAAERLLDQHQALDGSLVVTRMRPGIVGQRTAASGLLRYGAPVLLPAPALRVVPVLPLDRGLTIPVVHADDVADAVARALQQRAPGPFNLAADDPATAQGVADALGAKLVHVPFGVLRTAADLAWRARVQPVDAGWVALGQQVPVLDNGRAREVLGWRPTRTAQQVVEEVVEGMRDAAAGTSPPLRPRRVVGELRELVRRGPVSHRRRP
jgi:nucleoside-diphosphate-sugar epimerase